MESGFNRGQSDNLPKVDMSMVFDFLSNNPLFTSAEIRGFKLSRSARESYGDDAIGYVQVKREEKLCIVKARITPEHKVRSKPYRCTFVCNEDTQQIESVCCEDCVASQGGCKHAIALVMWLNRRYEEPSCTAVKCYWAKAKLSRVGSDLKFIKTADLVAPTATSKKTKTPQANLPPSDGSFLKEVIENSNKFNLNSMLMLYNKPNDRPTLSIHSMACHYKRQVQEPNADGFIQFCKDLMQNIDIKTVSEDTMNQSASKMWFELRYGRITASKLHEFARCGKDNGVLVEHVLGAYSFKDTKAIIRGKTLEPKVRQVVAAKQNILIKESGLLLNKDFPIFGASPDGISEEFVVEIKCPLSKKNIKNYVRDGQITNKYKAQIHLQMLFAEKRKGLFCIAHEDFEITSNVDIYVMDYDMQFCSKLMVESLAFWKKSVFKKVLML